MEQQQKNVVIDKSYLPKIGDILYNDEHQLAIIEAVYSLNKTSLRVNKNYNDQKEKYELLKKIIRRKEIIWSQHKLDLKLFPETSSNNNTGGLRRSTATYAIYLFYNDVKQYHRIYDSRYRIMPERKYRVTTGEKPIVRVNHGLCRCTFTSDDINFSSRPCCYWYGKVATPLSSMVTKKFIYKGNIYSDELISPHSFLR